MTEEKLNYSHFRQLLLNEQSRLKYLLGAVTTTLQSPDKPDSDKKNKKSTKKKPEPIDASELEATAKLKTHLQMVNDALNRLANSQYGLCTSCKKQIPKSRLESMPEIPHCLMCEMKQLLK